MPKIYSDEFKRDAVAMVAAGSSQKKVCRDLGSFDADEYGRPIKICSIVDEHTRECIGGLVERSITADRLTAHLEDLVAARGARAVLGSDNGPEFISEAMADWAGTRTAGPTSLRARRGATDTSSRSTAGSATSAWASTASTRCCTRRSSSATGRTSTTTTAGTPRSATYPQPSTLGSAPITWKPTTHRTSGPNEGGGSPILSGNQTLHETRGDSHHRHQPRLPTHRPTQRPPETQETPEPIGSRVSNVLRQDTGGDGGI